MFASNSNQIPLNRREFLFASGIVVAGGIASCSNSDTNNTVAPSATTPKQAHTRAPTIRVRIGRLRTVGETLLVGKQAVSRTNAGWKTKLHAPEDENGVLHIPIAEQTTIKTQMSPKQISNNLTLVPRTDISVQAFDVIAHVPIEQYIPGVLAGELFAHWHPTTFEAQAIAARSYATSLHYERIYRSHFDVDDDPTSQMYLGDVLLESAHRATKETSSIVLMWNNTVIPAYYCACCGGVAATATDAISASATHNIPPLQGRSGKDVCSKLDIHAWSASRESRTVRKRINACAKTMNTPEFSSIHTIRSIVPTSFNAYGRPTKLSIYDRRNNATEVLAKNLVRALNANILKLPKPTPTIWSSNLVAVKEGTDILFSGAGMGHGVGLCQYGAQELAGKGESWENILQWYYPQATPTLLAS